MKPRLSIAAAAADRTLLTVAELRAAVGIPSGKDTELAALNDRVAASIVRACRVASAGATPPTLRLETVVDTFRFTSRQNALVMSRRPIVEITSITEAGTALAAADYETDSSLLFRLTSDEMSPWACGKIVVTYSAGWETVPPDLKLAAAKLAGVFWSEGTRIDPNLKRVDIPGVMEKEWWVGPSDDPAIPQEVLDLLESYTNHWIG